MPDGPERVLVTGGAGYIGSALVADLLRRNDIEHVVSVDLSHEKAGQPVSDRLTQVNQDVRESLSPVICEHRPDTVIHLAFLLQTHRDEKYARSINVGATERLLEACAGSMVKRFIYLSSTTVYGARASNDRPFDESDAAAPTPGFQYSQHKVETERAIRRAAIDHPETTFTILRACPVMSTGTSNFISESLGLKVLPVPMGHDPELQFIHLDDLLAVFTRVLATENAEGARGIFNIAGEGSVRWSGMTRISGATKVPVPLVVLRAVVGLSWALRLQSKSPSSGLAMITHPWLASTEKATNVLGWKPRFTSRQAVEDWARGRS